MTTTILKISKDSGVQNAISQALSEAGVGVVEVRDWDAASAALRECGAALVVQDGELLDSVDASKLTKAICALANPSGKSAAAGIPHDTMRTLSHDLRTPLSAMAGWLHLMESGKLDEAGLKRAIAKLRGNIDDQVRTIDRYLGSTSTNTEGTSAL
jgi:signal transduction histidine kinase